MINPKTQKGSTTVVVLGAIAGIVLILIISCIAMFVSAYNTGNTLETDIKYAWENNKNILSTYQKKIVEMAQVPDLQKDHLKELAATAIGGRYGEDGARAAVLFIREQNPTMDMVLYRQIQTEITAGRNSFQASQTRLLDKKRIYETKLGTLVTGTFMRLAGFPRVPLDTYKIVVNESTAREFETGVEKALKLK